MTCNEIVCIRAGRCTCDPCKDPLAARVEELMRVGKAGRPVTAGEILHEVEARRSAAIASLLPASQRQVAGEHYKRMGVQPWDVVDTWPYEQRIGYYRGGALKYLMRMGSKDESPTEIEKGQHYLEKLLEVLRGGDRG